MYRLGRTVLWLAVFMDYCSLDVKNIGLEALCHLDLREPPRPPPKRAAVGGGGGGWCARLPPYTSDLHLFPLAAFIYLFIGALHIWHILYL